MNELKNQKQDLRPVETVKNFETTHRHLAELRERFHQRFGMYPSVMYVGREIYTRGFPAAHSYPVKAWAIDSTLVLEKTELNDFAIVLVKPPELKKAA